MLCIDSPYFNAHFNNAAEEYLLKSKNGSFFMLYSNEQAVIVGKHQNVVAEVNLKYCDENHILLSRRISGGGTVFHDSGNLNFCFITDAIAGKQVNFRKNTEPVFQILQNLGLNVYYGSRNELLINNLKISGNAEHVFKNRVLHHGTLLFSTDLEKLIKVINTNSHYYIDKSVKSVQHQVGNIKPFLHNDMDIHHFRKWLFDEILKTCKGNKYQLSEYDNNNIQQLVLSKYEKAEWIFGYSPTYTIRKTISLKSNKLDIEIIVKNGIINSIKIQDGESSDSFIQEAFCMLQNIPHHPKAFKDIFHKLSGKYNIGSEIEHLVYEFF